MTTLARPRGPITSLAAWLGADLVTSEEWIHRLTDDEIAELDRAVVTARATGQPRGEITRDDFPLPTLAATIDSWAEELDTGRGFVLVRGLPVDRSSEDAADSDAAWMYWGIGLHLGVPNPQNTDGDLLGHVRDDGSDPGDPSVRRYRTRAAQPYHTDGADVVGLLCLNKSRSGGLSSIVSSVTVYNEVLRRRPDLVGLMFENFFFDLYEQQAPGQQPYVAMPLVNALGDRLYTMYIRFYIDQAQRHSEVPRLSPEQVALLDLIDAIAADPRFHLDMDFEPGDVQLLSNATILHGRTAYEDDPTSPRHLLRLWLTLHRHTAA